MKEGIGRMRKRRAVRFPITIKVGGAGRVGMVCELSLLEVLQKVAWKKEDSELSVCLPGSEA
jgi:hypothetical protein